MAGQILRVTSLSRLALKTRSTQSRTAARIKMAQDDKKDYQLLATEESAPPPAYEAAASSSTSDVPDTQHALLRAQPVCALHI